MAANKRFAQVGCSSRGTMYRDAILETYADICELVGVCDTNPGRVELYVEAARGRGVEVPGYPAEEFDRMIAEGKPDCVIVTTKDCHHDEYVCRAMELGCDAITEKPMATDERKCQCIIDAQHKTGKRCTVTFNYRYSPARTQVKDLLMSGVIGEVLSVDFHWLLDTRHGADYFRRWHRNKENSGSLLVHKATHHFDLVNWSLSSVPISVFARGDRKFYTPRTAERYGLRSRSERCLDCPESETCPFYLDLRKYGELRSLYLDNEHHDGYFRDRCVFSETIDIYDTMQLVVTYDNGAQMSYSLNAFMPWEGMTIAFNGSKGRLESVTRESVYISGDGSVPGESLAEGTTLTIFPHFKSPYQIEVWRAEGGHGGGDVRLLDDIFSPEPPEDKYQRASDQRGGAYSILTGVAAVRSIETGREILISDLCHDIGRPDFPAMPSGEEPIPL
jgi:predicted dehydrogenase